MRLLFIACLHGLGLFQLVASQGSRTAWAPPTQAGAGLGPGIAPPDFTEYQNNMAIVQINAAATEEAAVRAATAVYNPMLDMSDAVQNALEDRIRQLRTPPGWTHRIPPPLPHNFDPMHLVMAMYYGQPLPGAPGAVGPAPVAPPPVGRTLAPQAGPPTSIRRGPPPPGRAGPGMGPMGGYGFEPTQWEIDLAVADINAATTEADAAKAAASVYRVGLDTPDVVVNAFEEKVARLRTPATWTRPNPKPLPASFRPLSFITRAWRELQQIAAAEAAAKAAADAKAAAAAAAAAKNQQTTKKIQMTTPHPKQKIAMSNSQSAPNKRRERPSSPPARKQQEPDRMAKFVADSRRRLPPPPKPLFPRNNLNSRNNQMSPHQSTYRGPIRRDPVDPFYGESPFGGTLNGPLSQRQDMHQMPQNRVFPNPPPAVRPSTKAPVVLPSIVPGFENAAKKINNPMLTQRDPVDPFLSGMSNTDPLSLRQEEMSPSISQRSTVDRYFQTQLIGKTNFNPNPSAVQPPQKVPVKLPPTGAGSAKSTFKRPSRRPSDIPSQYSITSPTPVPKPTLRTLPPRYQPEVVPPTAFSPPVKPLLKPIFRNIHERYPGLKRDGVTSMESQNAFTDVRNARRPPQRLNRSASTVVVEIKPFQTTIPATRAPPSTRKPFVSRTQQIWSPSGGLGTNINEILKFSMSGPADSVPIPTKPTPAPTTTTTTTTKKPTTTTTTTTTPKPVIPKKRTQKIVAPPPTISISKSKSQTPAATSGEPTTEDKLTQLQSLLEGISPTQLQNLVDIIKKKSSKGVKVKSVPAIQTPEQVESDQRPTGFIPPPPGSQNRSPPREFLSGPGGQMRGPQGPNNMPPWARNGQQMGGPQQGMGGMGGPPRGMGGPPQGMGGPPRQMGGPGRPAGPLGILGGMDPSNPRVARLIRVLSGRTGGARNPVTGEQPEAGEGGAGGMNPMMMAMLLGGGGAGGAGGGLASLLGGGGSGGGNPMAEMFGGGSGAGGLASLMGGSGGGLAGLMGGSGGSSEGGMNPAMLAALMGGGGGGSGSSEGMFGSGGASALSGLMNQGGAGGMGALGSLLGGLGRV